MPAACKRNRLAAVGTRNSLVEVDTHRLAEAPGSTLPVVAGLHIEWEQGRYMPQAVLVRICRTFPIPKNRMIKRG